MDFLTHWTLTASVAILLLAVGFLIDFFLARNARRHPR